MEAMRLIAVSLIVPALHSFMLQDVLGSLLAVLAFAIVLFAPGYATAYISNLFGFREMDFTDRSVWAIACSFVVAPITAYFAGKAAGLAGVCGILIGSAVITIVLLWRAGRLGTWSQRDRRLTAWIVCGWTAFVLLMLVDFQAGHKLYFSVVMADQSYRIAFTDSVVRTGIPPANPLYFAGAPAAMHYYYFWYVLCAAVVKIAHVSARQAFIASSVWAGFGLMVLVKLYTSHFFHWDRKQRWIALSLLAVTGADLIPALGNLVLQSSLNGDIEWWSVDPIDAWPDSILWVPHHMASVICCLLAFLFLWRTSEAITRRSEYCAVALAAAALASAFGLSVYVTFGFAVLVLAWILWLTIRRHPESPARWRRLSICGVLAIVLSAPFTMELARSFAQPGNPAEDATGAPIAHIFTFSVRRMIDSGLVTGLPFLSRWNHLHPFALDQTIRLLLLAPGLAMELGVYGVVLVLLLQARRHRMPSASDEDRDTAMFFTVSGLFLTLFVSSSVITNNDFGYRAVMLPQFFLLLLAADVLGSWWVAGSSRLVEPTPGRRRLVYGMLTLGVAGFLYGAILLRAWLPIEARKPGGDFSQLPEDAYQIRAAFAALDERSSRHAVVSFEPVDPTLQRGDEVMTNGDFYQRMLVMDTGRQMLNAETKCATHFGGDPAKCRQIQEETAALFASPSPSADWARSYCSGMGVQYLVLNRYNANLGDRTGWPVGLPVVAQGPAFRILQCGPDAPGRYMASSSHIR
jgi:multisubunit Na+/H+ antiporter MnhG subunit